MAFASAMASMGEVDCLSYLRIASSDLAPTEWSRGGVRISFVPRRDGLAGIVRYACGLVRGALLLRHRRGPVVAYNPIPWTALGAWALSKLNRTVFLLVVADLAPRNTIAGWSARAIGRLADGYVFLSPCARAEFPPRPSFIFPGVADVEATHCALPSFDGRVRFVFAGSLVEGSGIKDFLAAGAQLASTGRDFELHVFGRGTLPPLSDVQRDYLRGKLTIHGFVSAAELNEFMGHNCVGVNPRSSLQENAFNAPYKLLYYMSRGVPVITTVTGGVADQLAAACHTCGHGTEPLLKAMISIMEASPNALLDMGARARELVRSQYGLDALAIGVSEVLERLRG
jgi:glycosyltransferase involved in cell wall biosynthesis